jgi:hypothetical protein
MERRMWPATIQNARVIHWPSMVSARRRRLTMPFDLQDSDALTEGHMPDAHPGSCEAAMFNAGTDR